MPDPDHQGRDVEQRDNLSVLLIEDNAGDRRLAEIALREAAGDADISCKVEGVGTLTEGLALLVKTDTAYDAVLLDLGLPDAVGLDGLNAARAASPDTPIIVLTGLSDNVMATQALKYGASDYLDKAEVLPRPLLRAIRYAVERKKSERELVQLASTDPLTGLLNRRAFFDDLERARADARRSEFPCAIMVFDVDGFKEINDLYGHNCGDQFLIAVAEVLRKHMRQTDSVARIGGDEFAAVATHLKTATDAIDIAEKIVAAVRAITHVTDGRHEASVSVGVCVYPMDDSEAEDLVAHADMAMYKSKTRKNGSVNFFDAEMDASAKGRQALKRSIWAGIPRGEFFLNYQPIVDARTHAIVGAEGLARWRNEQNQIVPPVDFIPLAEESGLIAQLSARLLDDACDCLRRWTTAGLPEIEISLNVSPMQFRNPSFGLLLISAIERFQIEPRLINIEITESSLIRDMERTRRSFVELRSLGCKVHVDDFGTGYSSLSLLKDLPVDALKIDRSFVVDLGGENDSKPFVRAIIELARSLELSTIAEGVETEEQARILSCLGATYLQGYYFSRPVDAGRFASLLAQGRTIRAA